MPERNVEACYGLSPTQHGTLFQHLAAACSGDLEQIVCTLREMLDVMAARLARQSVASRHPALRTAFRGERPPEPLQEVQGEITIPSRSEAWPGLSPTMRGKRLEALLEKDRRDGSDLSAPRLMRLAPFVPKTEAAG